MRTRAAEHYCFPPPLLVKGQFSASLPPHPRNIFSVQSESALRGRVILDTGSGFESMRANYFLVVRLWYASGAHRPLTLLPALVRRLSTLAAVSHSFISKDCDERLGLGVRASRLCLV
jgi:hypothetical protein